MQKQYGLCLRREFMQRVLQLLKLLLPLHLHGWIALGGGFHFFDEHTDLDGFGHGRAAQHVLMEYMKRDGEQIRFRTADRLEVIDAQQAEEYFLDEIRHVSRPVPEPGRKKPSQPLPMPLLDVGNKCLLIALLQNTTRKTLPQSIRASGREK